MLTRDFLEGLNLDKDTVEKIFQEYGKAIEAAKTAAEKAAKPKDYDDLKREYEALKEKQKSLDTVTAEAETYKNQLAEKENLIKQYETKILKFQVATEKGLPLELADRLTGDSKDALAKDADNLASFVAKRPPLPLKQGEGSTDDSPYRELLSNLGLKKE